MYGAAKKTLKTIDNWGLKPHVNMMTTIKKLKKEVENGLQVYKIYKKLATAEKSSLGILFFTHQPMKTNNKSGIL